MKKVISAALLVGMLSAVTGCSPAKQEEKPTVSDTPDSAAPQAGMQAWGESTTAVVEEVEMPAAESAPVAAGNWDPGLMQPSEPSEVPQMWGADGSQPGEGLPTDVPMMKGADDPMPGQPKAASSPVPVLNSPADLMKGQGTPPPVLNSPADLIEKP